MDIAEFYSLFKSCGQAFSTDSRFIADGEIFFALKGENFNGNKFAEQALMDGAAYAVVDEKHGTDERLILVEDVLSFLQALATHHRRTFQIPVLAVAGSNGKTTTKELLKSVLSRKFYVHATQGNLNNLIGVPITMLRMKEPCDVAVIEIGTNQFGEIEQLCRILEPNYGIITNIGKEHLEGFGDIEGVTREESALYLHLMQNGGLAFVNADDPILWNMAKRIEQKFSYGLNPDSDYTGVLLQSVPTIEMETNNGTLSSPMSGIYNAQNVLAATAIGHYFDVSFDQISDAVKEYKGGQNRSEYIQTNSKRILLDAYNANPSSMEVTLRAFKDFPATKKLILLGDMLELGASALDEHRNILDLAQSIPNSEVFLVGPLFQEASIGRNFHTFNRVDELNTHLAARDWTGFEILVKGSRGIRMEKVLEVLNPTS